MMYEFANKGKGRGKQKRVPIEGITNDRSKPNKTVHLKVFEGCIRITSEEKEENKGKNFKPLCEATADLETHALCNPLCQLPTRPRNAPWWASSRNKTIGSLVQLLQS